MIKIKRVPLRYISGSATPHAYQWKAHMHIPPLIRKDFRNIFAEAWTISHLELQVLVISHAALSSAENANYID